MTTRHDGLVPRHDEGRAAGYLASGSWSRETTAERFHAVAQLHAASEAVVGLDGSLTYRELDVRSDQVAAWLISAGLPVGGAVMVQAGNSAETILAFYSLLKAGLVPVAALPAHRSHEIGEISGIVKAVAHLVDTGTSGGVLLDIARANAASHPSVRHLLAVGASPGDFVRLWDVGRDISADEARRQVEQVQAGTRHDDVAVFQLSGGTTGTPKVIPRLHAEYWNQGLFNARALGRSGSSRVAHVMPILHNAGVINALFGAHGVGGCVVPLPFGAPADTLGALANARTTDMMFIGPMDTWIDHPAWEKVAAGLDFLIYSGSKPSAALFERITGQGIWLGQTWGMAEGPYATTRPRVPFELRTTSVGSPTFATDDEMITVDATTMERQSFGKVGVLAYRGPSTLAGYFDSPQHDKVALTEDGFLLTGDLARLVDHEGVPHIVLEGRVKDVISRGGEKISTEEVEKLLRQHPMISEAAVVAMPDGRLGERACAYVAFRDPSTTLSLTDVQQHFEALGVAKFKWPERLEILPALPRTATLKIDKLTLRGDIVQRLAAEHSPGPATV